MTDNIAVLNGYTVECLLDTDFDEFPILIKPDTDLDSRFKCFDMDNQKFIMVNGWNCIVRNITIKA